MRSLSLDLALDLPFMHMAPLPPPAPPLQQDSGNLWSERMPANCGLWLVCGVRNDYSRQQMVPLLIVSGLSIPPCMQYYMVRDLGSMRLVRGPWF